MGDFMEVAKTAEMKDGTMKRVSAGGQEVLLVAAGGRYYCVQSRCPHLGGDLARGTLSGTVLECPLHHSQFDVADGRVVRWVSPGLVPGLLGKLRAPTPLKTYEVRVDGGRIMVRA